VNTFHARSIPCLLSVSKRPVLELTRSFSMLRRSRTCCLPDTPAYQSPDSPLPRVCHKSSHRAAIEMCTPRYVRDLISRIGYHNRSRRLVLLAYVLAQSSSSAMVFPRARDRAAARGPRCAVGEALRRAPGDAPARGRHHENRERASHRAAPWVPHPLTQTLEARLSTDVSRPRAPGRARRRHRGNAGRSRRTNCYAGTLM
jgi:hypothetical protein